MDRVDELGAEFVNLGDLKLDETEQELLTRLVAKFNGYNIRYLPINRGLSTVTKIVVKPASLFPFFVKIGNKDEITKEYEGYRLIYLRVPSFNIPALENFKVFRDRATLMYRYITGGRVIDIVDRMDTYLSKAKPETALFILEEILDVVMKKCHWRDGQFKMLHINLPELDCPQEGVDISIWEEIKIHYKQVRENAQKFTAPHGIVHGDLHPKNILVLKNQLPVLIDFSFVEQDACVYRDYAKLEVYLQFQLDPQITKDFWSVSNRLYSFDEQLIIPRSHVALAKYIHAIRTILWRNCMSKTVRLTSGEVDFGYRAHLLYFLIRFWLQIGNSVLSRQRAYEEIRSLIGT